MDNRPLGSVLAYLRQAADGGQADHDLLERFAASRDERAFTTLMRRHGPLVLGVSRRVLGNEHDAEEVYQATFLVLAKKALTIRQRTSLASWLYQVAYRLALRLRGQIGRAPPLETRSLPPADPLDDITWKELRVVLDEELARLPEKYRLPLLLCYLAGKTRDEAAEELGWPLGAVKGRLERGRELLRERLEKRGLALPAALLATALAAGQASAAPAALVDATGRAALHYSSGRALTGLVSDQVVVLAGSALAAPHWKLVLVLLALAGLLGAGSGVFLAQQTGAPTPAAGAKNQPQPTFTDITRESGIAQLVDDNYAAHPKWWLSGLHLVDLDGDGHLDLYLSAHGAGKAVAALNDGKGRFQRAQGTYPSSEIHLAYDIDEDGKLDLALTHQDGGGKWWLNRSRPGQLDFSPTTIERGTNTARRGALIDINRDGKVDWLRGLPTGIHFDLGDGQGRFAAGGLAIATGAGRQAEVLCIPVDIDGDGDIDLISEWGHYTDPGGNSRIFRNEAGKFIDITKESGIPLASFSIKGVGDVDQDGDLDLIAIADRGRFEIWLNDGQGQFTRLDGAITGLQGKPSAVSWGVAVVLDLDNDGIPDILVNGKHFLKVLRGQGGGRFTYMNKEWNIRDLAASSVDDGLCFGDIDGDGDIDMVGYTQMGGDNRRIAVYRNDLPKQNWLRVRPVGTAGNRGAAGAKIRVSESDTGRLIAFEQVAIYHSQSAQSYYGTNQTERHFGLGLRGRVDVAVEFYPSGKKVERKGVAANATLQLAESAE